MKKLILYASVILGLFVVLLIANVYAEKQKNNDAEALAQKLYHVSADQLNPMTRDQLKDKNYQSIVTEAELDRKLADKETFFVYYFKSDCPHCKVTTPIVNPIAEKLGIRLEQFNLLEYTDGWNKYGITGTPTIVYYKDGVEAGRLEGEISDADNVTSPGDAEAWLEKMKSNS